MSAEIKETPESQCRVYEDWIDIKDDKGRLQGNLRILIFLEDNGPAPHQPKSNVSASKPTSLQQARDQQRAQSAGPNFNPQLSNMNPQNAGDYQAVWQLEMWRRAEEAKFKAYLKQREIEKIEELTQTWRGKEEQRETTFNHSLHSLEVLEGKLRQNSLDLQRREERIIQLEEELKHKITEVSRQLAGKEEEVMNVKKRFKEDKQQSDNLIKRQDRTIEELRSRLDAADQKFLAFKQEIENSPLNVLRNELAQKTIEIVELETKVNTANEHRDEYRAKFEKVKKDMIQFKKEIDKGKELQLTNQAQELEQIKKQMRQNAQNEQEKSEFQALKAQLGMLQTKLGEQQQAEQAPQQSQAQSVQNPFQTSTNRYLDNYANSLPAGATQGLTTPHYRAPQYSKNTNPPTTIIQVKDHQPLKTLQPQGPKSDYQRLVQERAELVETGCYTKDDPLIQEMDRQIKASELKLKAFQGTH